MTINDFSAILDVVYERYNEQYNLAKDQYHMTKDQKDFSEMFKAAGGIMAIVDIQQEMATSLAKELEDKQNEVKKLLKKGFFAEILKEGS